jgi:hypothetical protein
MTTEIIAIPGIVFLAAALVAKLFELRGDVLYGPYIEGRKHGLAGLGSQLADGFGAIGWRQDYGRFALKLGTLGYFASTIIG